MKKIIKNFIAISLSSLTMNICNANGLNLEDLKRICSEHEQNSQVAAFTSVSLVVKIELSSLRVKSTL